MQFKQTGYIRDLECTKDTPLLYGVPDTPIYGKNVKIKPRLPGRNDTGHMRKIWLPELLPLENYDLIAVLLSGGKDSIACYFKLLELGVPKGVIELWHHDIDGGHPYRHMDWRCTQNYIQAFSEAEKVTLRRSWRVNGFFGELYRVGASEPIEWQDPETGLIRRCKPSRNYLKCQKVRQEVTEGMEEKLMCYGHRMKFPMKTGDLSRRWCSTYLKIMVCDSVLRNILSLSGTPTHLADAYQQNSHPLESAADYMKQLVGTVEKRLEKRDIKILVVSGERRGESVGRSRYNEMEIHRTNAELKAHRMVHQWRAVIDYSEKDVWELLKRHRINPHPCYRAGWNRCSCAMCIFSTPKLFAGLRELYPEDYYLLRRDEEILGFTLDNKKDLDAFVGDAESCVYHHDKAAIHSLLTGDFTSKDVYVDGNWMYPAGAFHGAEGGPC